MRPLAVALPLLLAAAGATATVPAEGLEPLDLQVTNAGAAAIACEAEIAHWFSADMGRAAPGEMLALDLWRNPASGVHATRNSAGEFLPVERVFCGLAGRAFATRWVVPLHPDAPAGRRLSCAPDGDRLTCR